MNRRAQQRQAVPSTPAMVSNVKRPQLIGFLVLWALSAWPQSAAAQVSPETQAQIAAYIEQSRALAVAYDARPRPDPYADLRAQSARLTADQRAQAQALFSSAFSVWRAEDYAAAELGFREGLAIDPANGSANFYLGDILRRRSDGNAAADYMARAAAFAPGSAEGLRARAALDSLPPPPDPEINSPPAIFAPPGDPIIFRDCADCPEMVVVPLGRYTMEETRADTPRGREQRRRITISRPFAVGRFEITRGQFAVFARETRRTLNSDCQPYWSGEPSGSWMSPNFSTSPGFQQTDDHPVTCVSWPDAQAYVRWLNTRTGGRYRLLSESEWEYAARAGEIERTPWVNDADACRAANSADAALHSVWSRTSRRMRECNDGAAFTAPVGSYEANAFGLFDVLGNVNEWTQDCETTMAFVPTDGSANELNGDWAPAQHLPCGARRFRGGAWSDEAEWVYLSSRRFDEPNRRTKETGFRVAESLE